MYHTHTVTYIQVLKNYDILRCASEINETCNYMIKNLRCINIYIYIYIYNIIFQSFQAILRLIADDAKVRSPQMWCTDI